MVAVYAKGFSSYTTRNKLKILQRSKRTDLQCYLTNCPFQLRVNPGAWLLDKRGMKLAPCKAVTTTTHLVMYLVP